MNDRVHVLVVDDASPDAVRLDKLGGQSFALRKARVKEQLLKMAAELLDIYAARAAHPGFKYPEPDELYREFEAEFPWEETPDQAKAIEDVVRDMRKGRSGAAAIAPMDRLVCGDVGYGKTEVAMRAAMLAVLAKKQVAVLVPTTVLAAQHERTFRERFKGYPVRIEAVSRMKTAEEVKRLLKDAAQGKIDVLVGTHRLLAADVSFKDLGLVVVDEEQRFGVAHKERLKKLRKLVDVLTLTATPIPRTLHMSLAGVRDLSIIATPPEDRRAIRTFVMKFDPGAVKEAIETELRRGGQVYFVHNRVESIYEIAAKIQELVPQARVLVGHGQMSESELEKVMLAFIRHQADVLIATSDDLLDWTVLEDLDGKPIRVLSPRPGYFDSWLVEAGPPAILTARGILLLYNGGNGRAYGDPALVRTILQDWATSWDAAHLVMIDRPDAVAAVQPRLHRRRLARPV